MIIRRIKDVEVMDVGIAFGLPEGKQKMQWIISNEVGDAKYHHNFAVRRFGLQPGLLLEDVPLHSHKYVESVYILSGRMIFENGKGEKMELEPGDTAYFYENEPHKGAAIGSEPAAVLCVIDCPNGGEDCIPKRPTNIEIEK